MAQLIPATILGRRSIRHFDPTDDNDGTVPRLICVGQSDTTIREHVAEVKALEKDDERQQR